MIKINGRLIIRGLNLCGAIGKDALIINNISSCCYHEIVGASIIVCKEWLDLSHVAVICRTVGITVVQVDVIDARLPSKGFIAFDDRANQIVISNTLINDDCQFEGSENAIVEDLSYQLGIVNEPTVIKRLLSASSVRPKYLFIRSELIWLSLQKRPYIYLNETSVYEVAVLLCNALQEICNIADLYGASVNFRALDTRTDEVMYGNDTSITERNPILGMHGLRQLLQEKDYFTAEMMAMDMLHSNNHRNILYSLPFVTTSKEVEDFLELRRGLHFEHINYGIYIETPAAVLDVQRLLKCNPSVVFVGMKDLTALLFAADRSNTAVAHLADPLSDIVISQIEVVLETCRDNATPVFIYATKDNIAYYKNKLRTLSGVSIPLADSCFHKACRGVKKC